MKTFFTFLLSVISLISFGQYSQVVSQSVKINFKGDKNFQAIVDGQTYYSDGKDGRWDDDRYGRNKKYDDNDINITNLNVGQHTITVYKMEDNRMNRGRGNNGNNNGTWGRNASSRNRVIYQSTFYLKQGYDMTFLIEGNGRAQITEERNRNRNRRWNNDRNNNDGYGNGNQYPNNRYRTPMADNQFNQILQNVRSKWFQSGKVSAVRDNFNNTSNIFSTYQARQLLLLINAETDKLELAKLAYNNIADPQNFTQIYDIFSSQYSREELDRYIRGNRY